MCRSMGRGVAGGVLVFSLLLTGCSSVPQSVARSETRLAGSEHRNEVTQALAPQFARHPGQSAFHLLVHGGDALAARAVLARSAAHTLDVQYYLYHSDDTGLALMTEILAAADRGVRVRLLVDDMDMAGKDLSWALIDEHPNIEVRLFNPLIERGWRRSLEMVLRLDQAGRRMHNKSMIADNALAIVGGRNIGDEYFGAREDFLFLDTDVLAIGPVVNEITTSFDDYWNSELAVPLAAFAQVKLRKGERAQMRAVIERFRAEFAASDFAASLREAPLVRELSAGRLPLVWADARLYYDRPEKISTSAAERATHMGPQLRPYVDGASTSVLVLSPYFVPGEEGVALFRGLVQRGVDVSILSNSLAANDVPVVHAGYRAYRWDLLEAGVALYELKAAAFADERSKYRWFRRDAFAGLHAKAMVVDARYVFIGSANLDPRSARLNTEIGLMIDSPELARQFIAYAETAMAPRNSYRMALGTVPPDPLWGGPATRGTTWHGERAGVGEVYFDEPQASFWRALQADVAAALPIEELL